MIGIIKLNTNFPRLPGDIGNENSFALPVEYETVESATVDCVVSDQPPSDLLIQKFIEAAKRLEQEGAVVIGTSCGFLSSTQTLLQNAVAVPVLTSSLILIPTLRSFFGENVKIAVLTFDELTLSSKHLLVDSDQNIVIHGLPKKGHLYKCIKDDQATLDPHAALREVLECANSAIAKHSDLDLFLLECTNLSPYKMEIRQHLEKPVFDLVDALLWVAGASGVTR